MSQQPDFLITALRTHDDPRLYVEADVLMSQAADEITALRAQVERLQSDLDANAEAFDAERTARLEAQAQAKTLTAMVERLQAAGQVVMPLAWMYHDGPSPDRIPSEMLGTVFVSLKRLPNYRNEIALVARSSTPAQEAADTGVDEREAFEKWARQQVWFQKHHLYRRDMTGSTRFGQYIQPDMELAWQSFRAALAARSGQVAAPAMVPLTNDQIQKLFREKHWHELGNHPFTWGAASVVIRAAEQLLGVSAPTYLQAEDLQWLQRFKGTTEDDQSYDVPKDSMKRLAELGVVRSEGFGRYSITAFGTHVADPSDQFAQLPLKTHADHEADYKAAFNAQHGLTVGGKASGMAGK